MKKLSAFIVDDDRTMCEALQRQLDRISFIEVSRIFHDGEEALAAILKAKPDIVFLDIKMPGLTGIEIAAALAGMEKSPAVVFVTANKDYALKAYEVDAVDYILKPFGKDDIERVLRKLRKHYMPQFLELAENNLLQKKEESPLHQKFCAYRGDIMMVIDSKNIELFYAEKGEVFILTAKGEKYRLKQTLRKAEQKLDSREFFRCHRNYIVNMEFVRQISPWFNRGYLLSLKGEKSIDVPVSRAHAGALESYIHF